MHGKYIINLSNQSSFPTRIKDTILVEADVLSMYAKFQLHPLKLSAKILLKFRKFTHHVVRQPIKLRDLDIKHMKRGGLLNKHICAKKHPNITNQTAENVNFHFSNYKSMGTISCRSNQSSYPTEIKTQIM